MKHYLTADTKEALFADLRDAGFEFDDLKRNEVLTVRGLGSAIYLEHLVETPEVSKDGEVVTPTVFTTTFHANALMDVEHTFATGMTPTAPQHDWA